MQESARYDFPVLYGGLSKGLFVYQDQQTCFRLGGPTVHSKEAICAVLERSPPMCFLHNRYLHIVAFRRAKPGLQFQVAFAGQATCVPGKKFNSGFRFGSRVWLLGHRADRACLAT